MTWRPRKRQLANGKTVWVARFKDERGRVRIARPAWNGGNGTFELKRDARRAIDEASLEPVSVCVVVPLVLELADRAGGVVHSRWPLGRAERAVGGLELGDPVRVGSSTSRCTARAT